MTHNEQLREIMLNQLAEETLNMSINDFNKALENIKAQLVAIQRETTIDEILKNL